MCALPGATQPELQSDLQMTATCAGLGSAQERLSCRSRPVLPGLARSAAT